MSKQPAPPTPRSTPKLSEVARHLTIPSSIKTTSWPAVRDTCLAFGITFDPWQDGLGQIILGKNADGLYAADGVVMSIPRQVGKTYLVGATVFALSIKQPRLLTVWTAHRYATAEDTFNDLKALVEQTPALARHVRKIYDSAGKQRILFHNGSRFMFGARERGFGRGFKKVGILVFDEAQILTQVAIDDMVPATARHPDPLIFYMGTPPKPSDPSEHFQGLREAAIHGEPDDTLYVEFSADEDAESTDREQWAKANPSYPVHTSERAMLRLRKHLGAESFLREGLGVWDPATSLAVFSMGSWARCATTEEPSAPVALGVASDLDQVWLSLGAASGGDVPHLGSVLRVRADRQRDHFVSEVKRIQDEHRCDVIVDAKGPASFLIQDLDEADVTVTKTGLEDFVQACADVRLAVETGQVSHGNYTDLNDAVDAAGWRTVSDRRVFARKNGDISSLEAVTLAYWAASNEYDVLDSIG